MPHWLTLTNVLIALLTLVNATLVPVVITAARDKEHHDLMWTDYKKRHHIDDPDYPGYEKKIHG